MRDNASNNPTSSGQLGILLKAKNLMKSVGSLIPGASVPLEMMNQLDGDRVDARIGEAEAQLKQIAEAQGLLTQALSRLVQKLKRSRRVSLVGRVEEIVSEAFGAAV